jgi:hypothetical protein
MHVQGGAGARLATPYLDLFGEEDVGLRRGKPLVPYIYVYIYIYTYMCVCVYIYIPFM